MKPLYFRRRRRIAGSPACNLETMRIPFLSLHFPIAAAVLLLLLQIVIDTKADLLTASGGVGVEIGIGGGGGIWVGGGGGGNSVPDSPAEFPGASLAPAYTALQAWKSAIKEDPLKILKTWVGTNVCDYRGVYCAQPEQGYGLTGPGGPIVAGIDLNRANLQGTLVKELSLLTDLTIFHLNSNRFTGTIPETFAYLSSLTELDLSNNRLSGQFPVPVLHIPNLLYLDLRFNSFNGPIPEDLFDMNLDAIFLNNNQFSGEIPPNLGNSPASVINLANNKLIGSIPFSLSYIGPKLREILFLNNQLTGCIPQSIGLWQYLQVLDLSFNSLMGHLPDTISCLSDIEVLNFGHNKLSGEVPDLICGLNRLTNLTVAYNFFSGFSPECSKLNVGFDVSLNCIHGRGMQRPQPECSIIPGGGLNCLRIPVVQPLVCAILFDIQKNRNTIPSSP